jgi:hypothetical protein
MRLRLHLSTPTLIFCIILPFLVACGAAGNSDTTSRTEVYENQSISSQIETFISYQPPFVPIRFIATESGIELESSVDFVTPIGTFSIGATLKSETDEGITVIFRNQEEGTEQRFYLEGADQLTAEINSRTNIQVNAADNTIIIDVTEGDIIEIRSTATLPACGSAPPSNLRVGMEAIAETEINIRETPHVPDENELSNINGTAKPGDVVRIVDGVACEYNGYWWKVRTAMGIEGWMKEATTEGQILLRPKDSASRPVAVGNDSWEMDVRKGDGLNLLVGDIGISGQVITVTDPWGNPERVISGSKPEFGSGGFEVYQHGAGEYRIEFLDQSFTLPLDDQFTRVTFTRR